MLIAAGPEIACSVLDVKSDPEILWLICHASPQTILLGVCYRPPNTNTGFSRDLNNMISTLTTANPNAHILLFGDFNFPKIDWHNPTLSSAYDVKTRDFIDVCLNFNLAQLVSQPTRIAGGCANILDLILANHQDSLSSISYLPEISDHKVIHANFPSLLSDATNSRKQLPCRIKVIMKPSTTSSITSFQSSKIAFTRDLCTITGRFLNVR